MDKSFRVLCYAWLNPVMSVILFLLSEAEVEGNKMIYE